MEKTEIRSYPRTHYDEFKKQGYRIFYFKDIITHLPEYHYHDYYEVSVILSSRNVNYVTKEKEYEIASGDIIICNVFEPHCYKEMLKNSYCERLNLGIDPTKLFQYSGKNIRMLSVFQKSNLDYPVVKFDFGTLYKYYQLIEIYKNIKNYHNELMELSMIQLLLAYLCEDCSIDDNNNEKQIRDIRLVAHIIEYINKYIECNITLSQLAKETSYSVSHICSIFKSITNKTIITYIKEKRMELALQYLRGNLSLVEAAEKAGFNNYSYFYKAFKKMYGISPIQYRNDKE